MKTLYLLRHAKASSDNPGLADIDRPLTDRGSSDAHLVSKHLSEKKIPLDVIITSPSVRTFSTAMIFAVNLKFPVDKIQLRKKLYDTSVDDYLKCISENSEDHVLIVGHNETITAVAQKLSKHRVLEMKTCSFVAIQFDETTWINAIHTKGKLDLHMSPEELKSL